MRVIRFDTVVYCPQYGAFASGDVLRCGEAFATHCVVTLKAAHYDDAAMSGPMIALPAVAESVRTAAQPARRARRARLS